jgi:MFS family permease
MDDRQREDLALVHRPQPVEKWWVMLGIGLGVLMYTIDTSIVKIALPTLVQDLRTDFATVQWVGLSYVLVVTSLVSRNPSQDPGFDLWGSLAITHVLVSFSLGMTEGQRSGFTSSLPLGLLLTAAKSHP